MLVIKLGRVDDGREWFAATIDEVSDSREDVESSSLDAAEAVFMGEVRNSLEVESKVKGRLRCASLGTGTSFRCETDGKEVECVSHSSTENLTSTSIDGCGKRVCRCPGPYLPRDTFSNH